MKLKSILFNPKFILSTHIVIAIAVAGFLAFNYFFGFGVLENAHLSYLRYKMQDTVILHNGAGSGGTGWVTSSTKSGMTVIITNGHVCELGKQGRFYALYKGENYPVRVLTVYPNHDLCAVEAPYNATGGYGIARSFDQGESVYTLGHPLLEPDSITKGELSGVYKVQILMGIDIPCVGIGFTEIPTEGLASLFGRTFCVRELESQASTVNILPGNSGSCTVNIYGRVVAVAFAANESGTRSYHVPLKDLKAFLELL